MSGKPPSLPPPPAFHPPSKDELRRSPRVALVVPLVLEYRFKSYVAETIIVSAHGALIQTSESFPPGVSILVTNPDVEVTIPARVVSARGADVEGLFEVAVEFSRSAAAVWGNAYKA
ncbi:MAG TPA: PilZ domain-containing protein [Thermoanaerobaculia bacterium]|nr:PilZ domain-containing protein [Thermoanaerobaculia bacterium]